MNATNYAKLLLKHQSREVALKIAAENLAICSRPSNTVLFDEAEFYISAERTLATMELNKTQSKKVAGAKEYREKKNYNFWKQVNDIIKKVK